MTHVNPAERPTIEDVVKFSFIRESQEPFKLSVCSNHVSHLFVVNRGLEQTGVHKPILSKYLLLARGINEAPLTQDPDGPTQGSSKLPTFCIAQWYGIIRYARRVVVDCQRSQSLTQSLSPSMGYWVQNHPHPIYNAFIAQHPVITQPHTLPRFTRTPQAIFHIL